MGLLYNGVKHFVASAVPAGLPVALAVSYQLNTAFRCSSTNHALRASLLNLALYFARSICVRAPYSFALNLHPHRLLAAGIFLLAYRCTSGRNAW